MVNHQYSHHLVGIFGSWRWNSTRITKINPSRIHDIRANFIYVTLSYHTTSVTCNVCCFSVSAVLFSELKFLFHHGIPFHTIFLRHAFVAPPKALVCQSTSIFSSPQSKFCRYNGGRTENSFAWTGRHLAVGLILVARCVAVILPAKSLG